MIKNKYLYLLIFALVIFRLNVFSQAFEQGFVIFTFEGNVNVAEQREQTYYWIVPMDSLNSNNIVLSHLFLDGFSRNDLDSCCAEKDFDPFMVFESTSYNFDSDFYSCLEKLKTLILKNRRKVQQINKKWNTGVKEDVTVFATPIIGDFCSSHFHIYGQQRLGYIGRVYLPVSSFKSFEDFWQTNEASTVLNFDFSLVDYDIIPY